MKRAPRVVRAACVVLLLACCATAQQLPTQRFASAIAASREAMRALVGSRTVPGASIAVAVDGQVVWAEGFGFADIEHRTPATAATQFGIGSVSKALTTTLFGRFTDKGIVDWDEPVQKYVPEFPYKAITSRMIAGHTSGLGDDFDNANRLTTKNYDTGAALAEIVKGRPRHAPGTEYYYGTSTYTVLAAALERATGKPFRELMQVELLDQLGLRNTIVNDGGRKPNPNRTTLYDRTGSGEIVKVPPYDSSFKLAGAGYLATAEDLARFGTALLPRSPILSEKVRSEVLRPMSLQNGTQPVTGMGEAMGVKDIGLGLGWNLATDQQGRRLYHQAGGGPGISAWLLVYPDERLVIAILSNRTSAPVGGKALSTTRERFLQSIAASRGAATKR